MQQLAVIPTDLAPGDARAASFDFSGFELHLIRSSSHPLFDQTFRKLWDEFASHGGMETRDVIVDRLHWNPARPAGAWSLLYRMIAVSRLGRIVAARDCSAICNRETAPDEVVVHLSHVLVDAEYRGTGLAGWMRAFPVQIARECHAGATGPARLTLVAEMEYPTAHDPMSYKRLASYESAGFLKVDPSRVRYVQPDFRDPVEIDSGGGPVPLPYQLVLWRIGRESERQISGGEIRRLVTALYAMYGRSFRPQDMEAAYRTLDKYPGDEQIVRLLPPTQ